MQVDQLRHQRWRRAARVGAPLAAMFLLTGSINISCSGDPALGPPSGGGSTNPSSRPASAALGRWSPVIGVDTCTKEFHDSFFVLGPDGKRYPTWHAPSAVDPANGQLCTFGHEHGRDPRGSILWDRLRDHFAFDLNNNGIVDPTERDASGIPFGYAAEQQAAFNAANGISNANRVEDHVGYKIAWENGLRRQHRLNGQVVALDLFCDVLTMLHQETHSADAFASNLHEIVYAADCSRGVDAAAYGGTLFATVLATFGSPGAFVAEQPNAGQTSITFGIPQPINSPLGGNEVGRVIPTDANVRDAIFVPAGQTSDFSTGLREVWSTIVSLRKLDALELALFNPAFVVTAPSRYFDTNRIDGLTRTIDVCYTGLNAVGNLVDDPLRASEIVRQARGPECAVVAPNGPATPRLTRIAFDDTRSPFNGCRRRVDIADTVLRNASGATLWYTDPYGAAGRGVAFPGSVRQFVGATSNATAPTALEPVSFGSDIDACLTGAGIHAPN